MAPKRTKSKATKEEAGAGVAVSPPKKQKTASKMSEPEKEEPIIEESDEKIEVVAPAKNARGKKVKGDGDGDAVNGKAETKGKAAAPKAAGKGKAQKAKEEAPAKKAAPKRTRGKKDAEEEKPAEDLEEAAEPVLEPVPKKGRGKKAKEEKAEEATPKEAPQSSVTVRSSRSTKKTEEVSSSPKKPARKQKKVASVAEEVEEDNVTSSTNGNGVEENAAAKVVKKKGGKVAKDEPKEKKAKATTGKKGALNSTETKWDELTFECNAQNKEGNLHNLHITSWNVGGIRSWLKKGAMNMLELDKPDVLCLQEIKCSDDKLPEELQNIEGYKAYWCSSEKDGYAGVGILSKIEPIEVTYGIGDEEQDTQGRCITAEFEKFYLVNVYVPNAGRGLVTLPYRLKWNELFKEYVKKLDEKKPVVLCGDMNVAHEEIDLTNPKTNTKNAGFTPQEREGMTEFLGQGYVDSFRYLYPDIKDVYTFWTYFNNARAKNIGWRLDYFIVSDRIKEKVCDQVIHSKILGSDHCPLTLYFNL